MKLHDPKFERALRRGVKMAVKKSAALKREYRAAAKYRRHYSGYLAGRIFVWGVFLTVMWISEYRPENPAIGLGLLSLWAFFLTFLHANALFLCLFASRDLGILTSLPLSGDVIFRLQLGKFMRRALPSLLDNLVVLGAFAAALEFSFLRWCGVIVISVLAWSVSLALAAFCVARLKRKYYVRGPKIVFPALLALQFFSFSLGKPIVYAFTLRVLPVFNSLLPTGWAISLFQLLLPHPDWLLALQLIPVLVIISTLPASLARLRSFYVLREVIHPRPYDLKPEPDAVPPARLFTPPPPVVASTARRLGPTEIMEAIQSRRFLSPPRWLETGRLESLLWRWFTPRERALSEFAFPRGLAITSHWRKISLLLAVLVAVGFVTGHSNPGVEQTCISAGLFLTGLLALGRLNDSGRMFRLTLSSGIHIPAFAYFPVGFFEFTRMAFKITAVQIPFLLVTSTVCGLLAAHLWDFLLIDGFMLGIRGAILLCASRFVFIVLGFSSGTNDTQRVSPVNLLLLFVIAVFGVLFMVFGGFALMQPQPGLAWTMTALGVLDACILFRVYAWFYARNFFDLMKLPRR